MGSLGTWYGLNACCCTEGPLHLCWLILLENGTIPQQHWVLLCLLQVVMLPGELHYVLMVAGAELC